MDTYLNEIREFVRQYDEGLITAQECYNKIVSAVLQAADTINLQEALDRRED